MATIAGDTMDQEIVARTIDGFLQIDQNAKNGDYITDPKFRKVSKKFKFYEQLSDSECSEDYDGDVFFEGIEATLEPSVRNEIEYQYLVQSYNNGIFSLAANHIIRASNQHTGVGDIEVRNAMIIAQHPNQRIGQMDPQQQLILLKDYLPNSINQSHNQLNQISVKSNLQKSTDVGMLPTETSLFEFILADEERTNQILLKDKIKHNQSDLFFNFGLKPTTWNLLVNKQIYMTFERLLIQKQLNEIKKIESGILNDIQQLKEETKRIKNQTENLKKIDARELYWDQKEESRHRDDRRQKHYRDRDHYSRR